MAEIYSRRVTVSIKREWSETYSYGEDIRTRDQSETVLFMDIPESELNAMVADVLARNSYRPAEASK